MGVQVVHHQHYPVSVGVVHVHHLPDYPRPIDPGAPVRDFHPAPSFQRRKQHEEAAHAVAPVFVIAGPGSPGPGRSRLASLLHLLFAGLVQAYQDFLVPILAMVDFKHVFHGAYELRAPLGWDDQHSFSQGLSSFFSASGALSLG